MDLHGQVQTINDSNAFIRCLTAGVAQGPYSPMIPDPDLNHSTCKLVDSKVIISDQHQNSLQICLDCPHGALTDG